MPGAGRPMVAWRIPRARTWRDEAMRTVLWPEGRPNAHVVNEMSQLHEPLRWIILQQVGRVRNLAR